MMPYAVVSFQETPNPNAIKCVLDKSPAPRKPRSYSSPEQTQGDPLGAALLAIPGVQNVLIHDGWISVGKSASTDWKSVKAAVKKVLGEAE